MSRLCECGGEVCGEHYPDCSPKPKHGQSMTRYLPYGEWRKDPELWNVYAGLEFGKCKCEARCECDAGN